MVHIGRKIKEQVDILGIGATKFGELLNKSRENIYDIYGRETVDTGLLFSCCKILNHDFFQYFYEEDPLKTFKENRTLSEADELNSLKKEIKVKESLIELQKELIFTQTENAKHLTLLLEERDKEITSLKNN